MVMRGCVICRRIIGAVFLLLMSSVVYGQGFVFDGYFNSGLGVVINDSESLDYSDPFFKALGVDSEQNGYRLRLNLSYTNEEKNVGVKLRMQSQGQLDPWGYFSIPYVYGWMKFFNDIIYLAGGIVDDSTWQTNDWWIGDDAGEGLGLLLKITPFSGLDIGAGVYLISQQGAGSNNVLSFGGSLPTFNKITPKIQDAKYVFSASYALPDVFAIGASFRLKNKAGWNYTREEIEKYGYFYDGRQESSLLIGEFRFLLFKNLTAAAAISLDVLEDFNASGNIVISQTFAYQFENLTLGLNMTEFLHNRQNPRGEKITFNPGLLFNLWGAFSFNNIEPRLDLVYFIGGMSRLGGNEDYVWHRRGFISREVYVIGSDNSRSPSVLSIRPSVKFNMNGNAFFEFGNMFNYDFGNWNGAYGDSGSPDKSFLISNVIYIDLKWNF